MSNIDLISLFQNVTGALADNRDSLNQADSYNGDHGDNMVEIFEVITQAMKTKSNADPADQLAYAAELLRNKKSGSAKIYAQGLAKASSQFQGKNINQNNALELIQNLLGGGQAPAASSPLEGLLGGLLGGNDADQEDGGGLDAGDLLNAGLAFLSAKNRGDSNAEALVNAVVSASPLAETPHRAESSKLVTNALFEVLGSLTGK